MTRTGTKQAGFSIIEVLAAVAAVIVLGATGWVVYQHNRTKATSAAAGGQTTNQQTTTPPVPTVTYLAIKEWGIKLPLADVIKDAYYVPGISSKDSSGQPNQMWIGFKALDASGCAATNNSGIALIFRARPSDTDPVSGELITTKYPNGVTLGGYYYTVEDFTANLGGTCKAALTTLHAVNAALADAMRSTTAAAN